MYIFIYIYMYIYIEFMDETCIKCLLMTNHAQRKVDHLMCRLNWFI